ncbi:topology modulation protein [Bacillus sp. THAF10]|uniref:AAA family ATPase n=1 Tax=Bacillus sp. THAF10 TaxID=2587848 RepID=UPI0012686089|nr:AAA family ATPase [Bacillus sp. THAF10]QFT87548.1 topology modulation protein [Bacillus sp. THAF10]
MKNTIPNRIHIIGSVGSGKTTLARKLSTQYNIPYFELDNVVWERHPNGDRRRSEEERDHYLETIVEEKSWIIEGAHSLQWVEKSFKQADVIIFLDPPNPVRLFRITKRYIKQLAGKEAAHYTPTFAIFKKMFKWNKAFEKEAKPRIVSMLQQKNSIVLKDSREIERYFHQEV